MPVVLPGIYTRSQKFGAHTRHGNGKYQTLCEGTMVRITLGSNLAAWVCALVLMLPLAQGMAQAQPAAAAAGASTAAEVKPAAPAAMKDARNTI